MVETELLLTSIAEGYNPESHEKGGKGNQEKDRNGFLTAWVPDMSKSLFIDVSCSQIWKTKQNTCGDVFLSKRFPKERRVIAVLSDGLGSGVKANILAQMTATMLLRYVEEGRDIEKAAEVMMDSLPICRVRKISYSTFTVVDCRETDRLSLWKKGIRDLSG